MAKVAPWDITISKVVLDHEKDAFCKVIPSGDSVNDRREALILWLLINTGIRATELCSLRVKDMPCCLGADFIEVHQGKRKKSRNVPVSEGFSQYIERYIEEVRPFTMPKRYAKTSKQGWLLFDRRGKKFNRQQIYYLVTKTGKRAGIKKRITPHKWRHRFATHALNLNGQNIYHVKSMLGHSSIATTEKYLHLAGMIRRGAGEALDQMPAGLMAN